MTQDFPAGLPFLKMHGLGNDFVILDLRGGVARPAAGLVARIADRHRGIGFDQLAGIEDADDLIDDLRQALDV